MKFIRIKILIGIFFAYIISAIIVNYSPVPFTNPTQIEQKIKQDLQITSNKISNIKLFRFDFNLIKLPQSTKNLSANSSLNENPSNEQTIDTNTDNQYQLILPTTTQATSYQPKYNYISPTYSHPKIVNNTPITNKPLVTPTQIPVPSDPPIGIIRPGKDLDSVLDFVSKKTCTPKALFKAIGQIEAGGKFSNLDAETFQLFNTYNWWNKENVTFAQICQGLAYNGQLGTIPSDSKFAGQRCQNPIGNPTDIKVMGPLQISEWEQESYRKKVKPVLGQDTIDRRVILDAYLIAGFHFYNISLYRGDSCQWEMKHVVKASCKFSGTCNYFYQNGVTGNYCIEACENYNKFAGTHFNCSSAPDLFVNQGNDGKCTLK